MTSEDRLLVRATLCDGVARLTLCDPGTRNALTKQLSDQLAEAVRRCVADGAAVLVLDAEPPAFCSGGSLEGLIERKHPLASMYAGYFALAEAPVPTIAVVAGAAVGAGVNLPLACDVVLAGESARFDPRFLDVGIHPGGGHLWRLAERIGEQGAAALVLCGDALTGREAEQRGLAWRCVPDDELDALATRLATRVGGRSAPLVRRTKESLRATRGIRELREAHAAELDAQEWSIAQPGFDEAVERVRRALGDRARRPG